MTDLERIARAIWADRAARILAEDIAGQREADSAGHLTYDELGEGFQRGLMSEAVAAIKAAREASDKLLAVGAKFCADDCGNPDITLARGCWEEMCDAILNGEAAV